MLKLEFYKISDCPKTKIEFYSSINPIPLSISIGEHLTFPNTIYCRNLNGENFIEFRFDKSNKELFEISLVTIQNESVKSIDELPSIKYDSTQYFVCKIIDTESNLEDNLTVVVFRMNNFLCLIFDDTKQTGLNYFQVGQNLHIGVDKNFFLKSILLSNLSSENLFDIFGF